MTLLRCMIFPLNQLIIAFELEGRSFSRSFSAGIYLLKVNNRNIKTRCEICSKLTIKTPEQCH